MSAQPLGKLADKKMIQLNKQKGFYHGKMLGHLSFIWNKPKLSGLEGINILPRPPLSLNLVKMNKSLLVNSSLHWRENIYYLRQCYNTVWKLFDIQWDVSPTNFTVGFRYCQTIDHNCLYFIFYLWNKNIFYYLSHMCTTNLRKGANTWQKCQLVLINDINQMR